MSETPAIEAQPAVLQATITITRATTGKVEEYTITGTPVVEPKPEENSASSAQ